MSKILKKYVAIVFHDETGDREFFTSLPAALNYIENICNDDGFEDPTCFTLYYIEDKYLAEYDIEYEEAQRYTIKR